MSPAQTLPGCKDIARQLVEEDPGRSLNVVLAGGEQMLRAKVNETDYPCRRGDGKDLVWDWMKYQKAQGRRYRYIRTRDQLLEPTTSADVDHLLGLFAPAHLPYDKERTERHPSLSEMTSTALSILTRNPAGFVLIVSKKETNFHAPPNCPLIPFHAPLHNPSHPTIHKPSSPTKLSSFLSFFSSVA